QSYFLFAMGRHNLQRVRFPLGEWTKDDARVRAKELDMPNWAAPDSQELCFVPDGDHAKIVQKRAQELGLSTDTIEAGEIRDESGQVVGSPGGIHRVTIGQRRGLGVASTAPRYVLKVLPEERAVVVGDADALAQSSMRINRFKALADLPNNDEF